MTAPTGTTSVDVAVRTLGPFPPGVRSGFQSLRREALTRAEGRVLDLGGLDPELDAYPAGSLGSLTYLAQRRADRVAVLDEGRRLGLPLQLTARVPLGRAAFDTVVCTGRLAAAGHPVALATRLVELLAPGGRLLVVEPSLGTGWEGQVARAVSPLTRGAVGWNPSLDVPNLLRSTGLVVTHLERTTISTVALPMRTVVLAVARVRPEPLLEDA